eukprot:15585271-Heterocapsa_arctica.AAC.1
MARIQLATVVLSSNGTGHSDAGTSASMSTTCLSRRATMRTCRAAVLALRGSRSISSVVSLGAKSRTPR